MTCGPINCYIHACRMMCPEDSCTACIGQSPAFDSEVIFFRQLHSWLLLMLPRLVVMPTEDISLLLLVLMNSPGCQQLKRNALVASAVAYHGIRYVQRYVTILDDTSYNPAGLIVRGARGVVHGSQTVCVSIPICTTTLVTCIGTAHSTQHTPCGAC